MILLCAEIIKYLQSDCGPACSHIHVLPVYHPSLLAHNSHHGSFGRGISDRKIDCRHYCANVIDTWNQVGESQAICILQVLWSLQTAWIHRPQRRLWLRHLKGHGVLCTRQKESSLGLHSGLI